MPTRRPPCITSSAPMRFSAISLMASRTGWSGPIAKTSGAFDSSRWRTVRIVVSLRRCLRRGYSRRRPPGVDEVEGALLGLLVQTAEVFADGAQGDELHAAQEEDHGHHRRPARHRVAPQHRLHDDPEAIAEGDQRGGHADVGRHAQRGGGEAGDAFDREVPQLPEIELARARRARLATVGNGDLAEANPTEQALHEAIAF